MSRMHHSYLGIILIFIVTTIIFSILVPDEFGFYGGREDLISKIEPYGAFAPFIIIGLIMLEAVIAPIPGGALPVIAAVLFPAPLAVLYSWIGDILGSVIAFGISRRYGLSVVKKIFNNFDEKQYSSDVFSYKYLLWILYALPTAPVDVLSLVLGLSDLSFKRFLIMIIPMVLIRMIIWVYFGDALAGILFTS